MSSDASSVENDMLCDGNIISCMFSGLRCGVPLPTYQNRSEDLYDLSSNAPNLILLQPVFRDPVYVKARDVLDAIAGPCASLEYNPVLSCGMKISDTAVEIILAGGEQVITGETVRQVEFLWTSMARLSTLEELILKRDLRRQVGRKVYSFILPRLKVEFSEHLSLLKDWIAAHKHYLERWNWKLDAEHDENFEGLRQEIRGMVQNCSGIEDLLTGVIDRDLPASNNVLDRLIKSMERISNKVNHVLADKRKLARLDAMREASDSDLRCYLLILSMEDIIQLPYDVICLEAFIQSERMRKLSSRSLTITTLPAIHGSPDILWPADKDAWERLAGVLITRKGRRFLETDEIPPDSDFRPPIRDFFPPKITH